MGPSRARERDGQPGAEAARDPADGPSDDEGSAAQDSGLVGGCLQGVRFRRRSGGTRRATRRTPRPQKASAPVRCLPAPAPGTAQETAPGTAAAEATGGEEEWQEPMQAVESDEDAEVPEHTAPTDAHDPEELQATPEDSAEADVRPESPRGETLREHGSFLGLAKRGKPAADGDNGGLVYEQRSLENGSIVHGSSTEQQASVEMGSDAGADGSAGSAQAPLLPMVLHAGEGKHGGVPGSVTFGAEARPGTRFAVAARSPVHRTGHRGSSYLGTNPMHHTLSVDHTREPDGLQQEGKEGEASMGPRKIGRKSRHPEGVRNLGFYRPVPGMLPPRPIPENFGVPRSGFRSACSSPMANPAFGPTPSRQHHSAWGSASPRRVHYAYGNVTPLRVHGSKLLGPGLPPRPHTPQYGCDTAHFYAPMARDGPVAPERMRPPTPKVQLQLQSPATPAGIQAQAHARQSPQKESAAGMTFGATAPRLSGAQPASSQAFPALFLANSHEHGLQGAWGPGETGRAMELGMHSDGRSLSSEDLLMTCSSSSDGSPPRGDFRIPALDLKRMHDSDAGMEKELNASQRRIVASFAETSL